MHSELNQSFFSVGTCHAWVDFAVCIGDCNFYPAQPMNRRGNAKVELVIVGWRLCNEYPLDNTFLNLD